MIYSYHLAFLDPRLADRPGPDHKIAARGQGDQLPLHHLNDVASIPSDDPGQRRATREAGRRVDGHERVGELLAEAVRGAEGLDPSEFECRTHLRGRRLIRPGMRNVRILRAARRPLPDLQLVVQATVALDQLQGYA